jgi:CRISPR-associated protein Cas1
MSDGVRLNTLYVVSEGAYLHRDHQSLLVQVLKETKLAVPVHHVDSVALFGPAMASPSAMQLCAESGVAMTFLSQTGRLLARVDAPGSGNVLLRRDQYRLADKPDACAAFAKQFVAGKLQNARQSLLRGARETPSPEEQANLTRASDHLDYNLRQLENENDLDRIRGFEGDAANVYFSAFSLLLRQQREAFLMNGRSRRPPLDAINALLSFVYALLLHDCVAALTSVGLDPSVGFLHVDRPGRPSLALDLMEEFRTLTADRLVLSLVNRKQVSPDGFKVREGGAVEMSDATRRTVIEAWQARKQEDVTHPLLEQKARIAELPFLQARLLARTIRKDVLVYPPCVLR